jgi:hypothetical protein
MRIDWFRVFADLRKHGWTVPNIAEQIAIPRTTMRDWCNSGAEPRHCDGEMLIEFYCWALGRTRAELPMQGRNVSVADVMRHHR